MVWRPPAARHQGYRYWDLERRVCHAMGRHDLAAAWRAAAAEPPPSDPPAAAPEGGRLRPGFTFADALAAHEAKSFDYRLLHLLLQRLLGVPYDEALLSFMAADERLVDIGDDLTDYEDDVVANSFNIYRGGGVGAGGEVWWGWGGGCAPARFCHGACPHCWRREAVAWSGARPDRGRARPPASQPTCTCLGLTGSCSW
jgi:hypothetical protein